MKITINVTPKMGKEASDYMDHRGCLVATALQHRFPKMNTVWVGASYCELNGHHIQFPEGFEDRIFKYYDRDRVKAVVKKKFSFVLNIPAEVVKEITT